MPSAAAQCTFIWHLPRALAAGTMKVSVESVSQRPARQGGRSGGLRVGRDKIVSPGFATRASHIERRRRHPPQLTPAARALPPAAVHQRTSPASQSDSASQPGRTSESGHKYPAAALPPPCSGSGLSPALTSMLRHPARLQLGRCCHADPAKHHPASGITENGRQCALRYASVRK